jgi:RNA polymerase sigma factor (sigma-70 family)
MTEPTDSQLLTRFARDHSEEAFATIVSRYVNLIYSAAFRQTGNRQTAEDITQAVFIILARKAGALSPHTVLAGWLYQTARLTAANYRRSEMRRARREQEAHMQSGMIEAQDGSRWQEIAPLLDDAMGRLGQTDRDALVLRYFENRTLAQVGAALGLQEAAAQKRVSRAIGKLRSFFGRAGVTLPAATIVAAVSAHSVSAAPAGLATAVATGAFKGGAVAASALILAKGVLNIMAWTKTRVALTAAAVAAIMATPIVLQHREIVRLREQLSASRAVRASADLGRASTSAAPPTTTTIQMVTNVVVRPFDWRLVESPDYRQYIANLRATGCPEQTVADIIVADVNKLFDSRRQEIVDNSKKWEYWREDPEKGATDFESEQKLEELVKEKRALLKELLGKEPQGMPDLMAESMRNMFEVMFNYLPADKRPVVMDLLTKYQDRSDESQKANETPQQALDREKRIKKEMEDELANILSSDQLEEWRLRTSDLTAGLRRRMEKFQPSEQEFRSVFELQQAFDDAWGRTKPDDPTKLTAYNAAHDELLAGIQQALGAQRYAQYLDAIRKANPDEE